MCVKIVIFTCIMYNIIIYNLYIAQNLTDMITQTHPFYEAS